MRKSENKKKSPDVTEDKREEQRRYLDGLKRYKDKGVQIFVDNEPASSKDLEKLIQVHEDGMFYMGDYIQTDTGELKEIRFDKVYNK